MPDDSDKNFTDAFLRGWRSSWLSFGRWLGGCAPILFVLFIIVLIIILIAIVSSHK